MTRLWRSKSSTWRTKSSARTRKQTQRARAESREQRAQAPGGLERPNTHLMRTADEVEVVPVQEFGHHVGPERERHAAVVLAPAAHVFVGVAPQEVAE